MNSPSQVRREIAQRVAEAYAANLKVVAVVLGGSTSRGHADRFSDVELGVYWKSPPTQEDRELAVAKTGGDLIHHYPYDEDEQVWPDDLKMGRNQADEEKSGILVEVVNSTTAVLERTMEEVLVEHNPEAAKQNLLASVVDGIPLSNPDLVKEWQEKAAVYPPELTQAVIRRYGQIDHYWRWQMWLERGPNLMMLSQSFVEVQHKILHVLLGLNRVYYFGFKWIDLVISRFETAPRDLANRLQQVYVMEPGEGAKELAVLVEETYDLVEQHCPEVDVARLRRIFRYQRPQWETMPTLD